MVVDYDVIVHGEILLLAFRFRFNPCFLNPLVHYSTVLRDTFLQSDDTRTMSDLGTKVTSIEGPFGEFEIDVSIAVLVRACTVGCGDVVVVVRLG